MQLSEILAVNRIAIDPTGDQLPQASNVLEKLAVMLASGGDCDAETVLRLLKEREQLLSTGVGDGVAKRGKGARVGQHQADANLRLLRDGERRAQRACRYGKTACDLQETAASSALCGTVH